MRAKRNKVSRSLFWRTFFLLALLLLGQHAGLAANPCVRWNLNPVPSRPQQQLASLVNLSRAALVHSDAIARVSLLKTMSEQEGLQIFPREPGDQFSPLNND
jgi:two-component system osmolarity sensor histidine kinase EnvZ